MVTVILENGGKKKVQTTTTRTEKDNVPFHTIFWPALLMGYSKYLEQNGKKVCNYPHIF